ncbi:YibE/F family protein [Qiania dongpingensis]|uniref:YibE/F family protein n=1 Tax=Qiania dongpingensis TaxID=2763669 RepID=A0A7G9G1Y1_9FIRM|nr:YibE/F family protein [Qiania dongpingensis]QNM04813.1 YibE/F family protein [Qiania dongpingensis]
MRQKIWSQMPLFIGIVLLSILIALPTGYEDAVIYKGTDRCAATVVSVDNSTIIDTGLIRSGEQKCTIRLDGGRFKGQETSGINMLTGSLEQDKIFQEGDRAMVVISYKDDTILSVNMIDIYRMDKELWLGIAFALLLVCFAGKKGFQSLLSFGITILSIWKIIVPSCLNGMNAILISLLVVSILTAVIFALVYGFDRRFLTAVCGSLLGIAATCILGILLTDAFQIHGAVMPYSESLIYSGFENLNLTQIFMSSIFIGASGAVMDLAVDITSAIHEVVEKRPDISRWEAVKSGVHVGRAAMGTMTTTLLLAYSGGYLALLMVFMAQGTPIYNILNYKHVASEILHTVVGSIGLVTVAPFTAMVGGMMLTRKKRAEN